MRYLLLFTFIFLLACGGDVDTTQIQKINDLQERIKEDSLLLASVNSEMDAINNVLDTANNLNQQFKNGRNMPRQEALDKIQSLNTLLNESSLKIVKLKQELVNSKSSIKKNSVITKPIDVTETAIEKVKDYYFKLENDIRKLRSENVSLKEIIKQKEAELIEKDDVISRIKKEREEQEKKLAEVSNNLAEVEARIKEAEREVEATKRESKTQKALLYYDTGVELKLMFDDIDKKVIEIGTGKIKKELAKQAYQWFKKSYELGYPSAKSQILEMEGSKKYSKHL